MTDPITFRKIRDGYYQNAETGVHAFRVQDGGYLPCTTNRYGKSIAITDRACSTLKQARGIMIRVAERLREAVGKAYDEALAEDQERTEKRAADELETAALVGGWTPELPPNTGDWELEVDGWGTAADWRPAELAIGTADIGGRVGRGKTDERLVRRSEELLGERYGAKDRQAVVEALQEESAHIAAQDLAGRDIVVMPLASAAAVSAALDAGQIAILVSPEIIEASLREIAEQSGVPIERVRAVHQAILNGEIVSPMGGMDHLYDCCPAAPTQPHTEDCQLYRPSE